MKLRELAKRKDFQLFAIVGLFSILCCVGAAVLYLQAVAAPATIVEYRKTLFDKLALGGLIGAVAIVAGWWFDDVKARRTVVFNHQIESCKQLASDACRLADAAADWLYHEADRGGEWDKESIYSKEFEKEIKDFGRSLSNRNPLVPAAYGEALRGFYTVVLKPYYLCRDRAENPIAEIGVQGFTCAEYLSALKGSVVVEFQRSIGLTSAVPEIDLSALTGSGSVPFGEQTISWDDDADRRARTDAHDGP